MTVDSPPPLAGKVVLITGAARRIGARLAQAMHGAGANVVLHYHDSTQDAAALAAELNRLRPGSTSTICANLLETAKLPALVAAATGQHGRLDVLINNASSFFPTPVGTITEAHWDDLIGSNVKGPLFLAQAAAGELRKARGLILNMVDIHALRPLRKHPVYCIAKAGLAMATRSLARELAPEVRVNGIAPGPVLWAEEQTTGQAIDETMKSDIIERTALKRMGSPDDIAKAALYFAIDAPYVTGQILAVDGGRSLGY